MEKALQEGREEGTSVLGLEQGAGARGGQSSEPSCCFLIAKLVGDGMPTLPALPFSHLQISASAPA